MRNQKKENNNNWKGGFTLVNGYILKTYGEKRKLEHRVIMEKYLKRKLKKSEAIHHINGNRIDNRLENLVLCKTHGEHTEKYHKQKREKGKFCGLR